MATLTALCLKERYGEAAALSYKLAPFFACLTREVNPIPCKKALSLMGINAGTPRLPLTESEPQTIRRLKIEMAKLGLLSGKRS